MNQKTRIDGEDLRAMFSCAAQLFEHNATFINELNVFPVPDGDTGTNMLMTLRDAITEAANPSASSAGEVAGCIYKGAFRGARGNSGVILAEFLKGMATRFEGMTNVGVTELAEALEHSRDYAYKAVGEPVEGTILTVIDHVAKTARECANSGKNVQETAEAISKTAFETVALTPTMLPVLMEAGVVDAGGQGLAVILEGMRRYTSGEQSLEDQIEPPEIHGVETGASRISSSFIDATEHELYGYCTQFMITGESLNIDGIREMLSSLAKSTVVVGGDEIVKIHLHAEDPGPVISYGVSLGTLSQVKIESMDEQHIEFVGARRNEQAKTPSKVRPGEISVIAVASGSGLEHIFLEELGVSRILPGGDTMNPSVKQILDVVDSVPTDDVIFLPNNKNIIMAAKQAAEATKKNLRVVNSKSIPQGICAMLEFSPDQKLDENTSRMEDALVSVRTGEVVSAVRKVNIHGVSVQEGQTIGLMEHELILAGDSPDDVLISLLQHAEVSEGDLVTIYWGGDLSEDDAISARERVETAFPGAEAELVSGGQPYYHYIVSIE